METRKTLQNQAPFRNEPQISIIVSTKNEEKNLERLLKSIKAQNYPNFEIIVVDNYSDDKTVEIAKKYTDKVFLKGPERSAQRNFGVQKSKGQYLLFLDADITLEPSAISEIVQLLEKGEQNIVAIKEHGLGKTFWEKVLALDKNCYRNEKPILAARAFPKHLFLKTTGFDTNLYAGEDWDLTLRCQIEGAQLKLTETIAFHHERTPSLLATIRKECYYIRNVTLFKQKHPSVFKRYSSFGYRGKIYIQNIPTLTKHPILTLSLFAYKLLIYFLYLVYRARLSMQKVCNDIES